MPATMPAKLFTSDLRILDGDRLRFDGAQYLVRIKPFERGLVDVTVVLLDSFGGLTLHEWPQRSYSNDEAINTAVWNCMASLDFVVERNDGTPEEDAHDARSEKRTAGMDVDFDYARFDCQR